MSDRLVVQGEDRKEFGKGASRRLRRDFRLPGVLYGSNTEPIHFHVDLLEMQALVRNEGSNAVFELEIDGQQHLSMVKHIDQNVLTFDIDHIDLLSIRRGEKVEVEIPVLTEGAVFSGAQLLQEVDTLRVLADVLKIPEEIIIDVEGLEAGVQITAGEIKLPEGSTLVEDPENLIINITHEEVAEVPEEGEEGGAVAEPAADNGGSDKE